jgi:hypothetical protein
VGSTIQFLAILGLGKAAQSGCHLISEPTIEAFCSAESIGYFSNAVPAVALWFVVVAAALILVMIIPTLWYLMPFIGIGISIFLASILPQPFSFLIGAGGIIGSVLGYIALVQRVFPGHIGGSGRPPNFTEIV